MLKYFDIGPFQQFFKDYEKLEPIGRGQYGEVYKARRLKKSPDSRHCTSGSTGSPDSPLNVAVKFMKCNRASEKLRIRDEIDILKELNHDNILKLVGAYESEADEFIEVFEYLRYTYT